MSLESLNLELFSLLNVPEHASILMQHFAIFIAHDLVYLMAAIFALLWLRGNNFTKTLLVKAFIFTVIALSISEIASYILNTPRPFVMHVGHTLIEHDATGSFPSNHMTIFSSIGFAFYFSVRRDIGKFLLAVAWLVAWSRIYVGVHFPIDMVGGFMIALVVNLIGLPLWFKYSEKLMSWILSLHHFLFKPLISKNIIK